MHDGPRARVTFAEKNHARFRLQGSVEPRQRMRGVSSQFDLDGVFHYALAQLSPRAAAAATNAIEGTASGSGRVTRPIAATGRDAM
jgi:hypothetical protein